MDAKVIDYLMDKMDSRRDRRDYEDSRGDRRDYEDSRRDRRDYEDYRDYEDERKYEIYSHDSRDYEDGRRGVKGSGRRDNRDYHQGKLKLSKQDMREWKQKMDNADGSRGAHYDMQQIMSVAEKMNVRFDEFSEAEFCLAVNMMYSDYCRTGKKYVPQEKALEYYADMALDFFNDTDAPEAEEKLALYYHCIVNA